jgi:hypothetical protein
VQRTAAFIAKSVPALASKKAKDGAPALASKQAIDRAILYSLFLNHFQSSISVGYMPTIDNILSRFRPSLVNMDENLQLKSITQLIINQFINQAVILAVQNQYKHGKTKWSHPAPRQGRKPCI